MVVVNNIKNPVVRLAFQRYPPEACKKLLLLRQLVLDTAAAIPEVGEVAEVLKWGEPSYISRIGSAIRMDWKASNPDCYSLYFNCKTILVETFEELYPGLFHCQGNRAIVFALNSEIPINPLCHCISLALTYKQRKHLPLLGV